MIVHLTRHTYSYTINTMLAFVHIMLRGGIDYELCDDFIAVWQQNYRFFGVVE